MGYANNALAHSGHGEYSIEVVRSLTNTRVLVVGGTVGYARVENDKYQLVRSTDEFVTTQLLFRFPSTLWDLTILKSGTLIAHVGTSPFSLWRSTNQGVTFTRVFDFPSSGSTASMSTGAGWERHTESAASATSGESLSRWPSMLPRLSRKDLWR